MASSIPGTGRRPQRPLPSAESDIDSLGMGQGSNFRFAAPEGQQNWLREAYRQAVNADTWHLGDKVDDKVRDAILAGVGGAQPPMYRGPDRQYYFQNARTMEDATTRGHRAQHFAGKTMDQLAAARMPGEDEYVTLRNAQSERALAAARRSAQPAANDNVDPDNAPPAAAVQALFGMMPDIPRTILWPDPRGADGKFTSDMSQWTMPQVVYDLARAFVTPGVLAEGGTVTDADALNLALAVTGGNALKAAPRMGTVTPAAAETLASRHVKLYNGPDVQRPFSKDYPDGHQADAAGNLTHDIDGNPLEIGGRIVGRSVAGGADQALPPTEFDAIAKEGTGRVTQTKPPSALGRSGPVGQVIVDRYSRLPKEVQLSSKLTPKELPGVYGHEIGHVIDQLAGEIPVAGLSKELKALYDTGNNPNRARVDPNLPAKWGKPFTPRDAGYKGDDIPREWMAEAIRLYMANPSYLKEAAPKTAAAIRNAVNRNPETRRIIQFNTGGAPGTALPLSDEEREKWEEWIARGGI